MIFFFLTAILCAAVFAQNNYLFGIIFVVKGHLEKLTNKFSRKDAEPQKIIFKQ